MLPELDSTEAGALLLAALNVWRGLRLVMPSARRGCVAALASGGLLLIGQAVPLLALLWACETGADAGPALRLALLSGAGALVLGLALGAGLARLQARRAPPAGSRPAPAAAPAAARGPCVPVAPMPPDVAADFETRRARGLLN